MLGHAMRRNDISLFRNGVIRIQHGKIDADLIIGYCNTPELVIGRLPLSPNKYPLGLR